MHEAVRFATYASSITVSRRCRESIPSRQKYWSLWKTIENGIVADNGKAWLPIVLL